MPPASVRLMAARFSVTGTTERRRSLSFRPTSLAHHNSLVEASPVPFLTPAAILAIHNLLTADASEVRGEEEWLRSRSPRRTPFSALRTEIQPVLRLEPHPDLWVVPECAESP